MWLIFNLRKEFEKIKQSFKERDLQIQNLKEKVENNSLKIATLEGSYLILSQSQASNKSQSQDSLKAVSNKSQGEFETKMIKRIKQNKKSLIMAEIIKLTGSHTTQETFETIVLQRKLCSKASFYRYLSSLKSQKLLNSETELRQKYK